MNKQQLASKIWESANKMRSKIEANEYKDYILPKSCRRRMSIEMASDFGWYKYIGLDGYAMCVNTFGSSAPASRVIPEYGFTVENAVQNYLKLCDE